MSASLLHVTFSHSAAHALRQALARLNRAEHVAMFPDDLGFGPLDFLHESARVEFYTDVMLFEPNPKTERELEVFWRDVKTNVENQVAWFSRRCVHEYAGFLAYVSGCDSPPQLVDVADVSFADEKGMARPNLSQCAAHIDAGGFSKLLSHVHRLSSEAYAVERWRWGVLKQENAQLRVLTSSGLISAPIDFFDESIRACVTKDWQKAARVLGDAVYRINTGEFYQARDSFIWFRLRHMMEEHMLDSDGDTSLMRECFVRTTLWG